MRFTNKFPYTNINNINLDWIIKRVKELGETVRSYANDIANAVALAEAAQDAADSVTGTAESAVATAQAAEATANAIAGTANSALSTAQAANTTAQAAEATANAIAGTANSALSTAQAANATAQAANATAQAAEESADNAETIAGTASANASNAVQTANTALSTAQTALTIASQFDAAALNEKAGSLITTESGAIVSFVPDRTIEQDLSVSVALEPVQDLHGYDSPWPAGGGKNKLPKGANRTTAGITFTVNDDGSVTASGTSTATAFWGAQFSIQAGTWTLSGCPSNSLGIVCDARDAVGGSGISGISAESGNGSTFTRTDALTAWFNIRIPSGVTVNNLVFYPMIEAGSAKTAFAPYSNLCPISGWDAVSIMHNGVDTSNPTIYSITIGETVYGGVLDATNGILTVDRAFAVLDGTEDWNKTNTVYYLDISNNYKKGIGLSTVMSSTLTPIPQQTNTTAMSRADDNTITLYGGASNYYCIFVNHRSSATVEEFKEWLTSNNNQFVYELATPFTITLDPVTIAAIVGQTNNIWSNAGDVSVEFAADLKWYIDYKDAELKDYVDNLIAELQALVLENGG